MEIHHSTRGQAFARRAPHAVLAIGLAFSVGLGVWQARSNLTELERATGRMAERLADRCMAQLERAALGLRAARGFFMGAGVDDADTTHFQAYADSWQLSRHSPGVMGVGFIRRVAPDAEASFIAMAQRQGQPGFAVRALQPHEGERRIIQFIAPVESNRSAIGLDIASEANRRGAAQAALSSETPVLTAPIRLMQSRPNSSQGVLMLLRMPPLDGPAGFGIADGPAGFVYSPIQLDELLASAELQPEALSLGVRDIAPDGTATDFGLGDPGVPPLAQVPAAVVERQIMGRTWQLTVRPRPAFAATIPARSPVGMGLLAAFVSMLLAALVQAWVALRQRAVDAERQAVELRELVEERSEMLRVLAHEVRQPLNNASAALQAAQRELERRPDGPAMRPVMAARGVLSEVVTGLDNTLAVAALLASGKASHDDIDIDTLLQIAVADAQPSHIGRLRIDRVCATRTAVMDLNLMRLALRNLLANALAYSPPESPVVLRVLDSDDPLAMIFEVESAGPAIADDLAPQLFERGTRGATSADKPGSGLGLYIVRRVMQLHQGSVALARNEAQCVVFRLVVPQALD
ncbi:CHASE domain-containing protein [Ideonella sp. DXS29W]|uniref:histidine kinase n=1 Tax=Ideonella lacteola TaxID=2984193 RepID=A0ABU9BVZ9_9BURK